ncbi:hypothetical protein [Deinococcus hopiensis]|uniref:hypothetical protein n=1 Tax=Deinococcus hopiensis TaxID=309885 RepID=UPI0009FEEBBC|nr:hypothetical protein [Deinococcus hopiensis]
MGDDRFKFPDLEMVDLWIKIEFVTPTPDVWQRLASQATLVECIQQENTFFPGGSFCAGVFRKITQSWG